MNQRDLTVTDRLNRFRPEIYHSDLRVSTPKDASRYLYMKDRDRVRQSLMNDGWWIPDIFFGYPIGVDYMVYANDRKKKKNIATLSWADSMKKIGSICSIIDNYLLRENVFHRSAIVAPELIEKFMNALQPYLLRGIVDIERIQKRKGPPCEHNPSSFY